MASLINLDNKCMKFIYQAKNPQGQLQKGVVEATSREAVIDVLQKHGLVILDVKAVSETSVFTRRIKFFEKVKSGDVVIFSRQLSTLFGAKVPLVESLQILSSQISSPFFQGIIMDVTRNIEAGVTLSQALSRHPKAFSEYYVSMIKSGETSGKLEDVLNYLAISVERQYILKSKVFNALIYPIFVMIVFIAIILLMFIFVMPKLKVLIDEVGQDLPLVTSVIFGISDFLINYGYWLLPLVILGGGFGARYFLRTSEGKLLFDKFKLRIPMFGILFQKIALARFADSLSTLIAGGLPAVQAIGITADVIDNLEYKNMLNKVAEQIKKGFSISSVLKTYPNIMPLMVTQMVYVGEETGRLEEVLKKVADFYEKDTSRLLDSLVTMIEPIMIVMLGGFVFALISAILLPIYNIAQGI